MQADTSILQTKPHFKILDGLRGITALIVVAFRLQPMVVLGMIIGAALFYYSDSPKCPLIHTVPVWALIVIMLVGFTLLPVPPSMDIRGWDEMHPLNGPGWSLFYEYIANILYAIGVRKLSDKALSGLVFIFGLYLIYYTVTSASGDVMGGWTLSAEQLHIGFTRLLYPFFGGLLLSRIVVLSKYKNAFPISIALLVVVLVIPRLGGDDARWMNGLYESLVIVFVFPVIIYIGASGTQLNAFGDKACKFLGDIFYPMYITHFPLIYAYTGWLSRNPDADLTQNCIYGAATFVASIVVGFVSLKYFDEPVRAWMSKRKFSNSINCQGERWEHIIMKRNTKIMISLTVFMFVVAGFTYPSVKRLFHSNPELKVAKGTTKNSQQFQAAVANVISFPCAVILEPDSLKVKKLKAENPGDNFYTAADDWLYYIATSQHYLDSLKVRTIHRTSKGKLLFRATNGTNYSFNTDSVYWGVVLFNGKTKPVNADVTNIDVDYNRYMK